MKRASRKWITTITPPRSGKAPGILGVALLAAAGAGHGGTQKAYPPAIELLRQDGAKVSAPFSVPDGLTGYAIRVGGRDMVAYMTESGEYLPVGNLGNKLPVLPT